MVDGSDKEETGSEQRSAVSKSDMLLKVESPLAPKLTFNRNVQKSYGQFETYWFTDLFSLKEDKLKVFLTVGRADKGE